MPRAREHSRELTKAFNPVRFFLIMIGQMPFEVKHKEDGTVSFKFNKKGKFTVLFSLAFFFSTLNYIIVCLGIFTFFIHVNPQPSTVNVLERSGVTNIKEPNAFVQRTVKWELYYTQRELVTCVVVWSWMTIAVVGSSYVLFNGKYYVHYFNYWNKVVQVMDMDVTSGIRKYLVFENTSFLIVITTLLTLYVINDVKVISDTATVMANFYFRVFNYDINQQDSADDEWRRHAAGSFGFLIMVYAFAGSRANIVQFLFFVRCLTNASRIWNQRLETVLTKKGQLTQEELTSQRLDHRLILKDHYVIVQLFKMTDNLFSRILLTYYSLQIMTVVLEIYQLVNLRPSVEAIRPYSPNGTHYVATQVQSIQGQKIPDYLSGSAADKEGADWNRAFQSACVVTLLLMQGIIFTMLTTREASGAYEEGMRGFQILRRSNYLSCDSKTERNFIHSLVFSYARNNPLNVTAGGYFAVDKTLIPSLVGTVLNYVVAVYTLQPDRGSFFLGDNEELPVPITIAPPPVIPVDPMVIAMA